MYRVLFLLCNMRLANSFRLVEGADACFAGFSVDLLKLLVDVDAPDTFGDPAV